ncbi:DUF1566 domain-containing protein [Fulvivirga lutimaris]|uniref:Lcl domain-containing protein n=1 Tax=Fulvivirga lutimaris TaxID=1819566 RepID=UPI0016289628|nr:DUF1566 domain-containing protein [Fulvivirga lutimaris]
MNKLLTITLMFLAVCSQAQAPNTFRYQAAIQSNSGEPMANQQLTFRINILRGAIEKTRVYSEFQSVTTDDFGMVNIEIGTGNVISGSIAGIDWSMGAHFLKVELDENGQANFKSLSEVQLLSVPYALYAERAGNVDDADANPNNEIQELSIEGQTISISSGNSIDLPVYEEIDGDTQNELQTLTLDGDVLSISEGNQVTLPTVTDSQTLSINGNELSISGGNSIILPTDGNNVVSPNPDQPVPMAYRGGLIYVHPTDNAESIVFGTISDVGATADGDGAANTVNITSALGAGVYAAQVCADLEAFGFDDWYLPSRAELDAIYKQNYLLADYGLEGYWSSTETAVNKGWAIDFLTGGTADDSKNLTRRCRCVRK